MAGETLRAKLGLQTKEFSSGLAAAQGRVAAFASAAKTAFASLGLVAAMASVVAAVKSGVDEIGKLGRRAKDIGITAGEMKTLSTAARASGIEAEKLDVSLKKLALTTGKDAKTAMVELAAKAEEGTLSLAEAQKYFGENALEMIRLCGQGKAAVEKMFEGSETMDGAAVALEKVTAALAQLRDWGVGVIAQSVEGFQQMAEVWNDVWNKDRFGDTTAMRKNEEYIKRTIEAQKRADAEREKAELERKKRLAELDALDRKLEDARHGELSDLDKILNYENDIANLEIESEKYAKDSVEYGELYRQIIEKTIALESAEKRVKDAKAKADEAARKSAQDAAKRAQEDAKKAAEAEQRRREQQVETERKINQLHKDRAALLREIAEEAKRARDETVKNIAEKAGGQTGTRAQKVEKYTERAEKARAEGRWNDYSMYSQLAEKYRDSTLAKHRAGLERKIAQAEKSGDTNTAKRLRDVYDKEGFSNKGTDAQLEKLKEINENTKETAEKLADLLGNLK